MKKQVFEGYTISTMYPVWTVYGCLNLGAYVQRTYPEAYIRYCEGNKNTLKKVRITIEEINER